MSLIVWTTYAYPCMCFFVKINYVKVHVIRRHGDYVCRVSCYCVWRVVSWLPSHAAGLCSHHRRRRQDTSSWPTVSSPAIPSLKPATRNMASICAGTCSADRPAGKLNFHIIYISYLTLASPLSGKIFLRQGGTCYGKSMYQIRSRSIGSSVTKL